MGVWGYFFFSVSAGLLYTLIPLPGALTVYARISSGYDDIKVLKIVYVYNNPVYVYINSVAVFVVVR